jgi:hypothetical protein
VRKLEEVILGCNEAMAAAPPWPVRREAISTL